MSEPDEGHRFKDLWAWADEEGEEQHVPPVDPAFVTAVMVVRDAGGWLDQQLAALDDLDPRPARIVAVDAGSEDDSPRILAEALASGSIDELVTVGRDTTFAESVLAGSGDSTPPWLWILHDDSAPEPDALGHLLAAAPSADVLFPKLLAPRRRNYPDVIAEAGQSISRTGQRVGAAEEGEIDQHQIEPSAILGGSTAGMLVRGDAWRELGGLAPELPGSRDGVDFGWRANVAGWRVVTTPLAALVHRSAGRTQERPSRVHPHYDDRLAALRVVGARGTGGARLALSSWARALGFLLAKSPAYAAAELRAHRRYAATPEATRALAARIPEGDASYAEDLLPERFWAVRNALDRIGSGIMDRYRDFTEPDTTLDDLTSDEFSAHSSTQRRLVSPGALLATVFLVVGIAAAWRLWGAGTLVGGGLLPAPDGVTAAWEAYGADGAPWLGIAAVLGTAALGQPLIVSYALVLLGPLLAALAAHSLLRSVGVAPWPSSIAAAAWASSVLVLGLPAAGDVSGLVLAMAGPLLVKACLAVATDDSIGAESLRAPARAAFWLFVVAAFWPFALLLATAGAAAVVVWQRARFAQWAVPVVAVWLLVAPWLPELFRNPGRWLTGADPLAWPDLPPSGYALLVGRIVESGIPVWLSVTFSVGLALAAAWSLTRVPSPAARWAVAGVIAVGLVAGAGASRLAVTVDGDQTRALVTAWALVVVGGMIAAVVLAHPADGRARRDPALLAVAAVAAVAAGAWPFVGLQGPVRTDPANLPGYVYDVVGSPRASRALLIAKADGRLEWNIVDRERPRWGSGERAPAGEFGADFEGLVQAFSGGNVPEDLAERLRTLAVSHVWLDGFGDDEILAIGNAAGLTHSAASETAEVFTVVGLVSRANVVDGGTATPVADGIVPEGVDDRVLTVSAPRDAELEVRVGGTELAPAAEAGELPTYALGEAHGVLEFGEPREAFAGWWTAVLLAALALLAAPTMATGSGARRGDEEVA